ncbi:hypothetical protein [Streptosporangium sp. NPDC023615]|uniref:hypothetical protein n=1 Tax=Streptosporangium sp. NPDC023615 TaxID=3154794 RepID=UPI00343C4F78
MVGTISTVVVKAAGIGETTPHRHTSPHPAGEEAVGGFAAPPARGRRKAPTGNPVGALI